VVDNSTIDTGPGPWAEDVAPGRLVNKGHAPGDILEAWKWQLLEHASGLVVVEAHLPEQLMNRQGQLFGGFTTTYVDFVSLHTVHSETIFRDRNAPKNWLTTINMRCDYFEPIVGPSFTIRGELIHQRGLTSLVSTKFFNDGTMLAHGLTTLRQVKSD
jgi:acyl-coenzyme A thioesterase PaaI-like protein